jgi:hypothetical protein
MSSVWSVHVHDINYVFNAFVVMRVDQDLPATPDVVLHGYAYVQG